MPPAVREICFIVEGDCLCFLSPAASSAGVSRTAGILCRGGAVRKRFKEERRSAVRHPAPGMKFHRSAGTLTEAGIPVLSPERTHGGTRNNRNIINADKIFLCSIHSGFHRSIFRLFVFAVVLGYPLQAEQRDGARTAARCSARPRSQAAGRFRFPDITSIGESCTNISASCA